MQSNKEGLAIFRGKMSLSPFTALTSFSRFNDKTKHTERRKKDKLESIRDAFETVGKFVKTLHLSDC